MSASFISQTLEVGKTEKTLLSLYLLMDEILPMSSSLFQSHSNIGGLFSLVEAALRVDVNQSLENAQVSHSPPTRIVRGENNTFVSDDDDEVGKMKSTTFKPREIFPQRLMSLLADQSLFDIISWMPHGRSFVIMRPDVFSDRVLPSYFPSSDIRSGTKYPSFTRKLNRWGFRQASRGPDTGAFHHPLFRRDQIRLCLDMVCQRSRPCKNKSSRQTPKIAIQGSPIADTPAISLNEKVNHLNDKSTLAEPSKCTLTASCPTSLGGRSTIRFDLSSTGLHVSAIDKSAYLSAFPDTPAPAVSRTNPQNLWLPNNPVLLTLAVSAGEEAERLNVYKSLLYESYLKALSVPRLPDKAVS